MSITFKQGKWELAYNGKPVLTSVSLCYIVTMFKALKGGRTC